LANTKLDRNVSLGARKNKKVVKKEIESTGFQPIRFHICGMKSSA
jgi:hypothetical protein